MVRRMAAKPLSPEQADDAARLRKAYELWCDARKARGEPATQDEVAGLFGMGQSALSQYINGKIPLNADALRVFSEVLGIRAMNISPTVVAQARALAEALERPASDDMPAASTPTHAPAQVSTRRLTA